MRLGDRRTLHRAFSPADVRQFARISGDHNPVHLDLDAAKRSGFSGTIVHGILAMSALSSLLASQLPGPGTIYLTQSVRFRKPVLVGMEVIASVEVLDIDAGTRRVRMKTDIHSGDGVLLIDGEALVLAANDCFDVDAG